MRRHVRAGRSSRCNAIVGVTYFSLQREKPVIGGLALRSLTFHQRPQEISNPVGRQGPAWSAVIDAQDKLASLLAATRRSLQGFALGPAFDFSGAYDLKEAAVKPPLSFFPCLPASDASPLTQEAQRAGQCRCRREGRP